jgi:hypothetical protein
MRTVQSCKILQQRCVSLGGRSCAPQAQSCFGVLQSVNRRPGGSLTRSSARLLRLRRLVLLRRLALALALASLPCLHLLRTLLLRRLFRALLLRPLRLLRALLDPDLPQVAVLGIQAEALGMWTTWTDRNFAQKVSDCASFPC